VGGGCRRWSTVHPLWRLPEYGRSGRTPKESFVFMYLTRQARTRYGGMVQIARKKGAEKRSRTDFRT